jgi:hypothetical protein
MDGRGHYKASLPINRLPPFICIHQQHIRIRPAGAAVRLTFSV